MSDAIAGRHAMVGIGDERVHRERQLLRSLPYPSAAWRRWLLRLLFMTPGGVVIAIGASGQLGDASPNAALLQRAGAIDWSRADSVWLSELYPHISTLLAAITAPLGAAGPSLVGVIVAGFLLHGVLQILHQREVPVPFGTAIMLALAATPLFFFLASENLPTFLAIAFFGMALADIQRFVTWGNTASGFRAGLLLAAAVLSDTAGIMMLAIAVIASPFLRPGRGRTPGLRAANALVLVFPTVATAATLVLLNLAFFGVAWPMDERPWGSGASERIGELVAAYTQSPYSLLVVTGPVVTAIVVAAIVRRPAAALVAVFVFGLINASFVLGILDAGAVGTTYLLMTLLSVSLMPTGRTRVQNALLTVLAGAHGALGWVIAYDRPLVAQWMLAVGDLLGAAFGGAPS
jgi:hypothetical protein